MDVQTLNHSAELISTAAGAQSDPAVLFEAVLWRAAPLLAAIIWLRHSVRLSTLARRRRSAPRS